MQSSRLDGGDEICAAVQPAVTSPDLQRDYVVYIPATSPGATITLSTGRVLPVRFVGEQHVLEDLGRIPKAADWLGKIQPESWMLGRGQSLQE